MCQIKFVYLRLTLCRFVRRLQLLFIYLCINCVRITSDSSSVFFFALIFDDTLTIINNRMSNNN